METVNNNNASIVYEHHNNIIVPKLKVPAIQVNLTFFASETTGKHFSKPIDPNKYNDY